MSNLTILIQLVIMVVCPHILTPFPALRHWPVSTSNDATGVLLGVTLWPSIGIFGHWPRCQCKALVSFSPGFHQSLLNQINQINQ